MRIAPMHWAKAGKTAIRLAKKIHSGILRQWSRVITLEPDLYTVDGHFMAILFR
jgi:hypothetical protein